VEETFLSREEGMGVSGNALLARARGFLLRVGVLVAFTLLMTLLYASPSWAETFTVTNLNNTGTGSLRAAINDAEARAGADEIVFADGVSGTITLASTLPTVTDPAGLIIDGGGDVTVSGNNAVQVFVAVGGALSLRNLKITDGRCTEDAPCFGDGGGIFNIGSLEVINSTFSGNESGSGGGIFVASGSVEVTNSIISNNHAFSGDGGGIDIELPCCQEPPLTVTVKVSGSTISNNSAAGGSGGGGISNIGSGTLKVNNSTISGNESVAGDGGGILNRQFATLEITDSTIRGNTSSFRGEASPTWGRLRWPAPLLRVTTPSRKASAAAYTARARLR
jgi:hypothetical protein